MSFPVPFFEHFIYCCLVMLDKKYHELFCFCVTFIRLTDESDACGLSSKNSILLKYQAHAKQALFHNRGSNEFQRQDGRAGKMMLEVK